jgi:hypothetical protein
MARKPLKALGKGSAQNLAEGSMTATNYARLAALIFAIVAVLQLARAVSGLPVTIGATTSIPIWASWIACIVGCTQFAPSIGEKLEIDIKLIWQFSAKTLKSLALPRGLEPLFSP